MITQLAAAFLGFSIALGITPWVMRLAREFDVVDRQNEDRPIQHASPVPRLGGVAIFGATFIAAAIVLLSGRFGAAFDLSSGSVLPGMVIGAAIVFITGVVDDLRGVRPSFKLIAQFAAALAVVAYGFRIDALTIAGNAVFHLGVLSVPLTVFWVVGMTNAFNLIDGVDGLAGTMALIGLTACVAVDYLLHGTSSSVIVFATIGAVFAFLHYNRAPARIFLGDSGSMLLGFFLSIRIVYASTDGSGVMYALVPIFALAYPLTDTFIAIARRWVRGHPFSRADARHVHHQILALGLSARRSVDLLGLFFFCVALMGMSIAFAPPRVTLALGTGGAVLLFAAFFYGVKWLRYTEFSEFGASVASVLLNARSHVRNRVIATETAEKLLSAESIEQVNAMLAGCAPELGLLEVSIVPGTPHFLGPVARQITPVSERPFRVDYPIAWEHGGKRREVVLRLWCERSTGRRHVGAERFAMRLGGALELWLRRNPAAFGAAPSTDDSAKRLSPRAINRLD
jgi:UDP-GlcNAc:undecaprenyl-phosphate GlcNAc-1-phosphate transferase